MNTENKEVILLILKTLIPSVYLSCLTNIADKHTRFKMQSLNSISLKLCNKFDNSIMVYITKHCYDSPSISNFSISQMSRLVNFKTKI